MPVVAAVVGVVGLGLQVGGMVAQNKANRESRSAAIELGEENAQVLERQAEQGKKVMGYQLGQFDEQAGRYQGTQLAAMSASGVAGGGSSSLVRSNSIKNLKSDRTNLYDNYQVKIDELYAQADLTRKTAALQGEVMQAQNTADMWNMGANVMNTAGNIAGSVSNGINNGWI